MTLTTMNLTDLALHDGARVDDLRPFRLRTVVEIGSRKGGTLVLRMPMAEPDAVVISLDLPFGLFSAAGTSRPTCRTHPTP